MGNSKELIARLETETAEFYKTIGSTHRRDMEFAAPEDEPLTAEEIAQIDAYWGKYKFAYPNIDYKSFEIFKNRRGRLDVRHCPDWVATKFFIPHFANRGYASFFRNKVLMELSYPDFPKPRMIASRMRGICYDERFQPIDQGRLIEICCAYVEKNERLIVKPGAYYGGRGIVVLDKANTTPSVIEQILTKDLKNTAVVFQEVLKQSPFMDAFNSSSVNTIRIITLLFHEKVTPLAAVIRVGKAGSVMDNWHSGGSLVGVDINSGRCNTWALCQDMRRITVLPSGLDLEAQELIVPNFEKAKECVIKAHYRIPYMKLISWDVALDRENTPTYIECNWDGHRQVHEAVGPLFGELLDDLLDEYVLQKFYFRFATEDFVCKEYHDHVEIEAYAGDDSMVVIPEKLRDKPVTAIDIKAFEGKKISNVSAPLAMMDEVQKALAATKRDMTIQTETNSLSDAVPGFSAETSTDIYFDLNELFEKLDNIDDAEKLTEMTDSIRDSGYTIKVFWEQWNLALKGDTEADRARAKLKCTIIARKYSANVPVSKKIKRFTTPHGLTGIHISNGATIGSGCTILQHVVIGSNTFLDSKSQGIPVIGDNVFFGAGSMVIGNVTIGNNVRIGANCVVTKDVPDNCVVVSPKAVVIQRDGPIDNRFLSVSKYLKMKSEMALRVQIGEEGETYKLHPVLSDAKKAAFDSAFRITFAGDLILLEDQVKRGYTGDGYDFSPVFEYAREYIVSADYAIGVLEGPMAGEDVGYSSSNVGDGKRVCLNFPDQFGYAVKNAGFDLVTTANNHVLDCGEEGVFRTLEILDEIGLDHTGSYRDASDKQNNRIKLVEREGIKMALLSYTYGSNGHGAAELTDGSLSYITSVIGRSGELFEKLKSRVKADFEDAKKFDPDLIIVLPHLGTQFTNEPNANQQVWFEFFKECGADIIIGDHAHAVQPAFVEEINGRKVFSAYCPGNFADIYRKKQGDTSMLIDVYIDRSTKQIIGGSIVPLYTQSPIDGNYRALPIYEIVNNTELRKQLSTDDYNRARNANKIVTKVVFGSEMDISGITKRYYFDETGFIRMKTTGLNLTMEMKNGTLYKAIESADSICFIGDSITEGTLNGGCPWYEPILEHIGDKTIYNFSGGRLTVSYMNQNINRISKADLYVIAIGTNDVRYRNEKICAMTPEAYVAEIHKLKTDLAGKNPSAGFVFIAPWYSTDGDKMSQLPFPEKTALNNEYTAALKNYCQENGLGFIDPNPYIQAMLKVNPDRTFLRDCIHPNAGRGVIMYSEAVLLS